VTSSSAESGEAGGAPRDSSIDASSSSATDASSSPVDSFANESGTDGYACPTAIPLSSFDRSCTSASDCVKVQVGPLSGECCCPELGAINKSSLGEYNKLTGGGRALGGGSCGSPCFFPPSSSECVHSVCSISDAPDGHSE
jgi:hypothetical protein